MDKIIISKGGTQVVLPPTRNVSVGGKEISVEKEMISGKLVKDIIGFRRTAEAEWELVPAETMSALHALLREGGYFYVQYPDPVAGTGAGYFSIEYPEAKIFKFIGTEAFWYGVSLKMMAQEVI